MTVCTCMSKLTENGKPQRIDNNSVLKNLKIEQGPDIDVITIDYIIWIYIN